MIWEILEASTGGSYDELGEDLVAGGRDVGLAGDEATLGQQLGQGALEDPVARGILGTGKPERAGPEAEELQTAAVGRLELGDLQGSRPEVDPQKRLGF